jgi:hypothetical protein
MQIRDAVEADADRMAELADGPPDVMRNLVHDRTVRIAERATDDSDADDDSESGEILGFVSFDARERTVHVTQLEGGPEVCDRLLEEPVRFARGEGMAVELLVPEPEDAIRTAAADAGFDQVGSGPRFDGTPTIKYRLEG